MKAHELARRLLDMPDIDVTASVCMSIDGDESTYHDRVFSDSLCEAQDDGADTTITLIFECGYKNEDMLETERKQRR